MSWLSQVTYDVDIEELPELLDKIVDDIPFQTLLRAGHDVSFTTIMTMRGEAPSSLKSGRGYRGPTLRDSIKTGNMHTTRDEISFVTGPTKAVDEHDLGTILELGSNNPVVIVPKKGRYLKFIDKAGTLRFEQRVTRGIIPPNPFVKRTAEIMRKRAPKIFIDTLERLYRSIR